jgi:hypothetical protein
MVFRLPFLVIVQPKFSLFSFQIGKRERRREKKRREEERGALLLLQFATTSNINKSKQKA